MDGLILTKISSLYKNARTESNPDKAIEKICEKYNGSFLHSSNFSLSMNKFLNVSKRLARDLKNYDISILEKHHIQKLDKPSGTALLLKNEIQKINSEIKIHLGKYEPITLGEFNKTEKYFVFSGKRCSLILLLYDSIEYCLKFSSNVSQYCIT